MREENPLVSVLMTSYNRAKYIAMAVESVLNSTYSNFELIITDDCSTDETLAIAQGYAHKDDRVKVFRNEVNLRDYPNRNRAATYAKGKYLKYLDSDDTIHPHGLEYCVKAMEQYPEAGIGMAIYGKEYLGEDPFSLESEKVIRQHFFAQGCLHIGPSGSIIRRDVFEAIGGFDTRFGVASDNFFNISLASKYSVVFLPQSFFFYRLHDGQEQKDKAGYLKYNYLYLRELIDKGTMPIFKLEIKILKEKNEKRFASEIFRYLLQTKNASIVFSTMNEANFSFCKLIKAVFY
jgi:glycosyltransferase involved in cell wall biosynthesis